MNLLSTIRLAQSILKRKFPPVDKPLKKYAPQKGPLKNINSGAYFRNFTVSTEDRLYNSLWYPTLSRLYQIMYSLYFLHELLMLWESCLGFFFRQVCPCKIFFPSKSVCGIFFSEITHTPLRGRETGGTWVHESRFEGKARTFLN